MTAQFLAGATAMGCAVVALVFRGYWRTTGDRFFALFAVSFAVFAVNRVVLGLLDEHNEARPALYVLRFIAFALMAAAIADKNRPRT